MDQGGLNVTIREYRRAACIGFSREAGFWCLGSDLCINLGRSRDCPLLCLGSGLARMKRQVSTIVCFDRERDVSRPKHVKGACTALSRPFPVPRRKAGAHILKLIAHPSP